MAGKRIITVFGSTGNQGGAVVRTFLNDPRLKNDWAVRGVTRDVTKESSRKLAAQGVEVVSADLRDKASLVKAISGSHAVFAVTNYWEKMDAEDEIQQGKSLADAAKETGVQHYIWSSLYNVTQLSKGKLSHVYHFDSKAKVEEYVREIGIPATFFMPGFYMPNLPGGMFSQSGPNKEWAFGLPTPSSVSIPLYYPGDTGKYVKAALLNREKTLGKRILAATQYMTGQEIVDAFKKAFPLAGKTATFSELPEALYRDIMGKRGMPEFIVTELYENMRLMHEFGYYGGESLDWTHSLIEDPLTTWEEFMKEAKAFSGLE